MGMSDHDKQQVVQEFFVRKVTFCWKPGKRKNWILLFYKSKRSSKHVENMSTYSVRVEAAWHTILNCCIICSTEQPREQPQIGDRGSNPVAVSQLFFFSVRFTCSRSLSLFVNIHYFTWFTSF